MTAVREGHASRVNAIVRASVAHHQSTGLGAVIDRGLGSDGRWIVLHKLRSLIAPADEDPKSQGVQTAKTC